MHNDRFNVFGFLSLSLLAGQVLKPIIGKWKKATLINYLFKTLFSGLIGAVSFDEYDHQTRLTNTDQKN